jgi:hypothetical protein
MKSWLSVLVLLAGLGSSISFAQDKQQIDPFDRYLAGTKSNQPEAALVRFAGVCGVDINAIAPRYADRPGNSWMQVKDLSKGIHGLETDFFATVAVWKQSDRILVELWVMELDVASESRNFYCLDKRIITRMESVDWSLPITDQGGKENPGWGYEQLWIMTREGKYERTLHGFVDSVEKPISPPKLNMETQKRLNWTPTVWTSNDLKLPPALLR